MSSEHFVHPLSKTVTTNLWKGKLNKGEYSSAAASVAVPVSLSVAVPMSVSVPVYLLWHPVSL